MWLTTKDWTLILNGNKIRPTVAIYPTNMTINVIIQYVGICIGVCYRLFYRIGIARRKMVY